VAPGCRTTLRQGMLRSTGIGIDKNNKVNTPPVCLLRSLLFPNSRIRSRTLFSGRYVARVAFESASHCPRELCLVFVVTAATVCCDSALKNLLPRKTVTIVHRWILFQLKAHNALNTYIYH
jgi:hypothetical protein